MSNTVKQLSSSAVKQVQNGKLGKQQNSKTAKQQNFEQILCTSLYGISDYLQNLKTSLRPVGSQNLMVGAVRVGAKQKSRFGGKLPLQIGRGVQLTAPTRLFAESRPLANGKSATRGQVSLRLRDFRPDGSTLTKVDTQGNHLNNNNVGIPYVEAKPPTFVGDKLQSRFGGSVSLLANCKTNPPLKTSLSTGFCERPAEWIVKKINGDSVILQMNLSVPRNKSSKKQAIIPELAMNKMKVATHKLKNGSNTKQIAQGNPLNSNIKKANLSQAELVVNKMDNNTIKQFEIGKSVVLSEAKNLAYTTRKPADEFNMEFVKEGNKLTGKVIVDNVEMKQLLNSNLLALQKTLKKAGVKVDRIDIVIRGEKRETINQNSEIRGRRSKDTTPFVKQADYKPKATGYSKRFAESRSKDLTDKSQVPNSKKFFTIVQNDKKGTRVTPLPQDSANKPQATASEFRSMIDETKTGKNQGNFTELHTESATRGQDNNSRLDNSQKLIRQDSSAKPDPKVDKTPQNPAEKSNPQNPINKTNSESLRNSAYKTDNKFQISDKGLNLGLGKGHSVMNLQSELKFETLPKGIPLSNFEKLAEQLKLNFKGGRSEAKIELKPDWLGKLSIKLVIEDTKLAGKIVVDTFVAKHLLEHSLSDLKSALKSTGLEIENFNITLSEDSGQGKNSYGRATPYSRYPEKPDLPHSDWDWFFKHSGFSEGINYANETGRIDYFA